MKKKILVLNLGGIGDQILFFPVFETLKKNFNNSHITLVTEPRSESAVTLTELVDEIFICDFKSSGKYFEVFRFLKKAVLGKYDMVISSGSSALVSILLFLTGIKRRIGYNSGIFSKFLLTEAVELNRQQYAADMYHKLVSSIDNASGQRIPKISVGLSDNIKDYLDKLIPKECTGRKKIVIHPGVSRLSIEKNILKSWHIDRWAEFAQRLLVSGNYTVILTGGPDDIEALAQIRDKTLNVDHKPECLVDLSEKAFSIEEFAYIIHISDVLVCVDSSPMHIAVGVGKPVIALFGPTDEKKLLPGKKGLFTVVKNDKPGCRPCLWDKRLTSCENPVCLDIEVEQVINALRDIEKINAAGRHYRSL